jgi:hypothetical protein
VVGEERLAGVAEADLLAIGERLDGGVVALALARPASQQAGERCDIGMERRFHAHDRRPDQRARRLDFASERRGTAPRRDLLERYGLRARPP